MGRKVSGATRLLASALALALGVVSALTCLIGVAKMAGAVPQMSAASHACCAGVKSGCPTSAASLQQNDCCLTQVPSTTALSADRFVPPLTVVTFVAFAPPSLATLGSAPSFDAHLLKSSSPPTFLLDSAFRI